MCIVDIDFDVASTRAACRDKDTARVATDLGSGSGEGAVFETDIEKAEIWRVDN